ncbi:CBU_0592 family membrane protein (plasmid) [Sphaerotilus natans]|uniref:CBU_0592 family membrane protein n=1 Tax=Sphaerotilus natans TaxID=34103 RepID=UPI00406C2FA6
MIRLGVLDLVGLCGVCAYVVAHFLVQVRHESPRSRRIVALNVVGPLCVLVSLIGAFNISSFFSQSLWLLLTLAGWWKSRR